MVFAPHMPIILSRIPYVNCFWSFFAEYMHSTISHHFFYFVLFIDPGRMHASLREWSLRTSSYTTKSFHVLSAKEPTQCQMIFSWLHLMTLGLFHRQKGVWCCVGISDAWSWCLLILASLGMGYLYLLHPRFCGDMPSTGFNFFRRCRRSRTGFSS